MTTLTMRAAALTGHGGPEVIKIVDLPVPEPKRGEIRLKMGAAALNRLDLWVRAGWKGLELAFPHIMCADGAGEVDALGDGVTGWQVGDRACINPTLRDADCLIRTGRETECDIHILGEHAPGVAAQYACLPARNLLPLPPHVPYSDAAAAGLVYLTAWHSLVTRGGIQPGETVLIVGAGGGVNTASIQIAKFFGARTIVVGSDAARCAAARALGADDVIDRSAVESWSKTAHQLTGRRGADLVVDNVGQATLSDSIRAAARNGRVLIVGNTSGHAAQIDTRYVFSKHLSLIGSTMGTLHDYRTVMALVFAGRLRPVIGATLPLADAAQAQALLESGSVFGKVVLSIAEP
jgi:NADPH:quinone reductase-like Zn-dependent oxidoreductase